MRELKEAVGVRNIIYVYDMIYVYGRLRWNGCGSSRRPSASGSGSSATMPRRHGMPGSRSARSGC